MLLMMHHSLLHVRAHTHTHTHTQPHPRELLVVLATEAYNFTLNLKLNE